MKKMKRKTIIIIAIVLSIVFIGVCVVGVLYFYLSNNAQRQCILRYENDNSTKNLIDVCNVLYINDDIKFLDYVDILLDRPDFKEVYNQGENNKFIWHQYNDLLILQALVCAVKTEDFDLFEDKVYEYLPKLAMYKPIFFLSCSLCKNSEFANKNKQRILELLIDLYNSAEDDEKKEFLINIVAYYRYFENENEDYQYYLGELRDLMKDAKDYEKNFCDFDMQFSEACYKCMFTGIYNGYIISFFRVMYFS